MPINNFFQNPANNNGIAVTKCALIFYLLVLSACAIRAIRSQNWPVAILCVDGMVAVFAIYDEGQRQAMEEEQAPAHQHQL